MTRAAEEAHIRTLLVRELTGYEFVLHSVQSHDLDGGSGLVEVTAELQRHGRDDVALSRRLTRPQLCHMDHRRARTRPPGRCRGISPPTAHVQAGGGQVPSAPAACSPCPASPSR